MSTSEQLYDTEDMGLTIALICCNFVLANIERPDFGSRFTFCFQFSPDLDQAAQDYWNGKLFVDAKRFWNESKNLKTRLYSQK